MMDFIKDNWNLIKDTLRTEYDLSDISYNTWVKPLNFHSVKDDIVTITIPSDQAHALKYISSKYKSYFQVTISEMLDHTYDISFILEKDADNEMLSTPGAVYNINYENANLNSKYRFDTFVVGGNNKFAHSASLAVAESPGEAYNPLYLYGGAGLGKTHLMHSIGHFILNQNPDTKVLYVTSEQFTNEVVESIRSGNTAKMNKLREKYRTIDVLLIDDVQFIIGKESTQEEFFHTFNTLHNADKQIIISSDRPPKDIETLEERLRTRFECGLIADISSPDFETRMAILRKKEELEGHHIDDAIVTYIATNIKSTSAASRPAIATAFSHAFAASDDTVSPVEILRSAMPVRSRIHSSEVSTISAISKFVTIFSGRALPVPVIFIAIMKTPPLYRLPFLFYLRGRHCFRRKSSLRPDFPSPRSQAPP